MAEKTEQGRVEKGIKWLGDVLERVGTGIIEAIQNIEGKQNLTKGNLESLTAEVKIMGDQLDGIESEISSLADLIKDSNFYLSHIKSNAFTIQDEIMRRNRGKDD